MFSLIRKLVHMLSLLAPLREQTTRKAKGFASADGDGTGVAERKSVAAAHSNNAAHVVIRSDLSRFNCL